MKKKFPAIQNNHSSNNSSKNRAAFVAGGTGGHINSAIAMGDFFQEENYDILYFSGNRKLDLHLFKGRNVIHLNAETLKHKNILNIFVSIIRNILAFFNALKKLIYFRPLFVLGAGGYVCGPVCLAAFLLRIPFYILEQNSVCGITNRLLSPFSSKVFLHFKNTIGIKVDNSKVILTGNPVRKQFLNSVEEILKRKERSKNENFNILIFGGSLGATSINDFVFNFVKMDSEFKIHIKHQVGKGNFNSNLNNKDFGKNIVYEQLEYLDNIIEEYLWSDFIVCRGGASTISELRVIQRPAIIVPYPNHKDRHQFINALELKNESYFPVYIESVEELKLNNCESFRKIITVQKLENEKNSVKLNNSLLQNLATHKIFQEIVNDLS